MIRTTRGAEEDYALVGLEKVDQDEPLPPIKGQRTTQKKRLARKQGRIHGSISRVRVGRGSIVVGQGQLLKSDLHSALNTLKRRTERQTNGRIDIVTYRVACMQLKIFRFNSILRKLVVGRF